MKREIKFRAWDERNKIMHYDFQFIRSGTEGNDWIIFISDKQKLTSDWKSNPYFQQQLKLMQFIGFKNNGGNDIYEGDIIKYDNRNSGYGDKSQPNYLFTTINSIEDFYDDDYYIHICKAGEVIGNIYENPELLR